jgi:hypothetical protein
MLLKSRASPDMLPFSFCNKKRLCNSAHKQAPLSKDSIDSVLGHWEVGRAKDLSSSPRIFKTCVMWCLVDWREIPDVSNSIMRLHFQRSICLRRHCRWRHQDSSTVHQTLIQWQPIPCQKTGIVVAGSLPYPVSTLLCLSQAWKVICNLRCWVGSYCVGSHEKLVVESLPYGCPEHGSCRGIESLCAINLPPSDRKK